MTSFYGERRETQYLYVFLGIVKLLHNYRNARCLLSLYDRLERLNERANKAIQEGMGCQELADVTGLFSTGVVFSRSHFR